MFADEFEEYRARANSGGMLPLARERALAKKHKKQHALQQQQLQQKPVECAMQESPPIYIQTHDHTEDDTEHWKPSSAHDSYYGSRDSIRSDSSYLDIRPRVYSMPSSLTCYKKHHSPRTLGSNSRLTDRRCLSNTSISPDGSLQCVHRIRSFNITSSGGLQKNEDLIVCHVVDSDDLENPNLECTCKNCACVQRSDSMTSHNSVCSIHSAENGVYTIQILGDETVGKSTLVGMFTNENRQMAVSCSFGKLPI